MITAIISIVDQPITPILRKYCGEECFEERGLTSLIIDQHDPVLFQIISNCGEETIFNLHIALNWKTYPLYYALSKSKGKYCVYQMAAFPSTNHHNRTLFERAIELSPLHIIEGAIDSFILFYYNKLGIRPADFAIVSGAESWKIRRDPVADSTHIIKSHIPVYDEYLNERNIDAKMGNFAVFIDEYLPHHPDIKILGLKSPIDPYTYYCDMRKFFDTFEKRTGMNIVIAAHPKSDYEEYDKRYGSRAMFKGVTTRLIRISELVIAHDSTAINSAVLFEKPILFVTTDAIEKCVGGRLPLSCQIHAIANSLGKSPINANSMGNINFKKESDILPSMYRDYQKRIIKAEASPDIPFWEIYLQEIQG